jgi:hypothetical protein
MKKNENENLSVKLGLTSRIFCRKTKKTYSALLRNSIFQRNNFTRKTATKANPKSIAGT